MHKKQSLLKNINVSKTITIVMVAIFFVQPIHNIYADEIEKDTDISTSNNIASTTEPDHNVIDASREIISDEYVEDDFVEVPDQNSYEDIVRQEENATSSDDSVYFPDDELDISDVDTENNTSSTSVSDTNTSAETDVFSDEVISDTSTSTIVSTSSSDSVVENSVNSQDNELSSPEKKEFTEKTSFNDRNMYQFSSDECTLVENGSFFCVKNTSAFSENESISTYTDVGSSGFTDIFINTTNGTHNVTNSLFNNSAPFYDQISNSVVFQTEYEGRSIIESYDLNSNTTTQITTGKYNDTLPKKSGDYIVWQRWVNNAWQIVLFDGESERVITDSVQHNLSPSINEGFIVWSTFNSAGNKIAAYYDISSGRVMYIDNEIEGRVQNPRFVLVYETVLNNGDIVTHGFDPETGLSKPISSLPAVPLPDIPSPDPVGEVRALSVKNDEDESSFGQSDLNNDDMSLNTNEDMDGKKDIVVASSTEGEALEITEYDIYVPDYVSE